MTSSRATVQYLWRRGGPRPQDVGLAVPGGQDSERIQRPPRRLHTQAKAAHVTEAAGR